MVFQGSTFTVNSFFFLFLPSLVKCSTPQEWKESWHQHKNTKVRERALLRKQALASANLRCPAANGGVTNGGLRGVWPPFLEISRNWPFSPFFCLFRPFPEGAKSTWEIQKTEEKGLFPQISSDLLKPPSLKPPFAALQNLRCPAQWIESHRFAAI